MSLPSKPASLANCTDIGSAYDAAVFILEQWPDDEGSKLQRWQVEAATPIMIVMTIIVAGNYVNGVNLTCKSTPMTA